MRQTFQIYDTHTHLGKALHSGKSCTAEQLLEAMGKWGVDRSLLIPYPMVEDYREAHDEIAAAIRKFPDSFAGCACLDPYLNRRTFRDEIKRCVEELGFRALKLQPQYQPLNPISARSEFFFEIAGEFGLPVICHTGAGVPFALPSLFIVPARRFPELRMILAHAGGSIFVQEAIVAAQVCSNIFIELSSLTPLHVLEVLGHVESTRLLIGSDGIENLEAETSKILGLSLPPRQKRDILWETAHRLFG